MGKTPVGEKHMSEISVGEKKYGLEVYTFQDEQLFWERLEIRNVDRCHFGLFGRYKTCMYAAADPQHA